MRRNSGSNSRLPGFRRLIFSTGLAAALLLTLFSAAASPQKKAAAHEQFAKAEKLRVALQGKPVQNRTEAEFRAVINSYYRVYVLSPQSADATAALLARGELYQEMARQYDDKYFQSAIDAYQFLLHEYPNTRYRDDALFTIAQIQYEDLGDIDLAQKSFEDFVKRFPRSEKTEEAREALAEIAAEKEKAAKKPSAKKELAAEREKDNKLPRLTSIRHWNAENYTRVVIDVEDAVKFRADRIANPDRIYFDVYRARLSPALSGKTLDVQNGFLKTIRVAQNQEGIVRVVLEVEKVKNYSVFFLPNPYRMVVDVFGEELTTAKSEPAKAEPARPDARQPAKSAAEERAAAKAEKTAAPAPVPAGEVARNDAPAKSDKAPGKKDPLKEVLAAENTADKTSAKAAEKSAAEEKTPVVPSKSETGLRAEPMTDSSGEKPTHEKAAAERAPGKSAAPPPGEGRSEARGGRGATLPVQPSTVPQPTKSGQFSMTRALGLKIGRIVIDAGHGGHDTGTVGPTGLMEKDLCLDIALRLGRMIQDKIPGAEVVFTREDDTFIPLENRTAIANQARADMFISIHANSSRDKSARGIETYYLNFASSEDALEVAARENAQSQSSLHDLQDIIKKIARNEKIEESRELASEIQKHLATRMQKVSQKQKNRGVKKAPFVVLIGANMPSVLTEISFISNPADESLLKKNDHRAKVAEGLYRGLESYLQSLNSLTYAPPKSLTTSTH